MKVISWIWEKTQACQGLICEVKAIMKSIHFIANFWGPNSNWRTRISTLPKINNTIESTHLYKMIAELSLNHILQRTHLSIRVKTVSHREAQAKGNRQWSRISSNKRNRTSWILTQMPKLASDQDWYRVARPTKFQRNQISKKCLMFHIVKWGIKSNNSMVPPQTGTSILDNPKIKTISTMTQQSQYLKASINTVMPQMSTLLTKKNNRSHQTITLLSYPNNQQILHPNSPHTVTQSISTAATKVT